MRLFKRKAQARVPKPKREIPWAVRVSGRLLGLQGGIFLLLAALTAPAPPIPAHRFDELWLPGLLVILAFLSTLAAIGLLRLRPLAWDIAMLVEGAALLLTLVLYRQSRPLFISPLMVYCVLVVLNLNQRELRRTFQTDLPTA
jgi:hypothetical protein